MSEKAAASKSTDRHRRPNTATIIKAAKNAGASHVTFPDGTVVSLAPPSKSGNETEAISGNPWDAEIAAVNDPR
jgi:hypothetical protein